MIPLTQRIISHSMMSPVGTIIMVIGISLMRVGINWAGGGIPFFTQTIDGKVVHAGGVPSRDKIAGYKKGESNNDTLTGISGPLKMYLAPLENGAHVPVKIVADTDKVGKITKKQVEEIAKTKLPDLNAASLEAASRSVAGTARSMGIDVVD